MSTGNVTLVCIDSSEHSDKAFHWYCDKLHHDGDTVGLVHIFQLPAIQPFGFYGEGPILLDGYEHSIAGGVEKSKTLLKKYEIICKNKNIKALVLCQTVDDSIGHTICKISKETSATAIVIGQRGMGVVRRTLIGSVSDYIIHHAHIPTVVVPPST